MSQPTRTAKLISFVDSAMCDSWKCLEDALAEGCSVCYALGWVITQDDDKVILGLALDEAEAYSALRMSIPTKSILSEKVIKC